MGGNTKSFRIVILCTVMVGRFRRLHWKQTFKEGIMYPSFRRTLLFRGKYCVTPISHCGTLDGPRSFVRRPAFDCQTARVPPSTTPRTRRVQCRWEKRTDRKLMHVKCENDHAARRHQAAKPKVRTTHKP